MSAAAAVGGSDQFSHSLCGDMTSARERDEMITARRQRTSFIVFVCVCVSVCILEFEFSVCVNDSAIRLCVDDADAEMIGDGRAFVGDVVANRAAVLAHCSSLLAHCSSLLLLLLVSNPDDQLRRTLK